MARSESAASVRAGAVPGIIVNGVLLYAANVWPGWWSVPFLTPSTTRVMDAVNAAWIAGLVANAVYLLVGSPAIRALGEMVVLVFGLLATLRVWDVFPFDFADGSFDWALLMRIVLVVAVVGAVIGLIAQLVAFVRALVRLGGGGRELRHP
ncbi:hypothetical protein [Sinomonas flava]|uniref:Uncharacterized protein n=1 Tax=Sinomonas flava TaxID=496857 RepID=A0ABN3BYM0_9MICC